MDEMTKNGSVFETAGGSVVGIDHLFEGKANQDAFRVVEVDGATVVVVADGCSDGDHNEVGAHFGASALARCLVEERIWLDPGSSGAWGRVYDRLLGEVDAGVAAMAGRVQDRSWRVSLRNYWLFTLVAAVIGPDVSGFAAIGDGFLEVNRERVDLGKFDKNAPPYVAYALSASTSLPKESRRFRVVRTMRTGDLVDCLVGTDGMDYLVRAEASPVPGGATQVGSTAQFYADRFFKNWDNVRRRLAVVNGGAGVPAYKGGPLRDDTTLVVARRRSPASEPLVKVDVPEDAAVASPLAAAASDVGPEADPGLSPPPAEGELLGAYRVRLGRSGSDTSAAEATQWRSGAWRRVEEARP